MSTQLYNMLFQETEKYENAVFPTSTSMGNKFFENMKKLDLDGQKKIYALCLIYNKNEKASTEELTQTPFEMKLLPDNGGIEVTISELPDRLKHILYLFTKKHIKALSSEEKRKKKEMDKKS